MIMKKSKKLSHFQALANNSLEKYGERILQIDSESLYENSDGYSVHICEIDDEINDTTEENK